MSLSIILQYLCLLFSVLKTPRKFTSATLMLSMTTDFFSSVNNYVPYMSPYLMSLKELVIQ